MSFLSSCSEQPLPVLRRGLLLKQGRNFKSWKLRWFELHTDHTLRYYNLDHGKQKAVQKGVVDLSKCTNVLLGADTRALWPKKSCKKASDALLRIVVVTPGRNWFFVAETRAEARSWHAVLLKECESVSVFEDKPSMAPTVVQQPLRTSSRSSGIFQDRDERARSIVSEPDQYAILSKALEGADDISICSHDSSDDEM